MVITNVQSKKGFFRSTSSVTTDFREMDNGQNDRTILRVLYMLGSISQVLSGVMNATAPQDSSPKLIEWKIGQESAKQVHDSFDKQAAAYDANVQKDLEKYQQRQEQQEKSQVSSESSSSSKTLPSDQPKTKKDEL